MMERRSVEWGSVEVDRQGLILFLKTLVDILLTEYFSNCLLHLTGAKLGTARAEYQGRT
jgi:hypothetical protein